MFNQSLTVTNNNKTILSVYFILFLDEAVVTKINFNVEVDFNRHILKGHVVLEVERMKENINIFVS